MSITADEILRQAREQWASGAPRRLVCRVDCYSHLALMREQRGDDPRRAGLEPLDAFSLKADEGTVSVVPSPWLRSEMRWGPGRERTMRLSGGQRTVLAYIAPELMFEVSDPQHIPRQDEDVVIRGACFRVLRVGWSVDHGRDGEVRANVHLAPLTPASDAVADGDEP